MLETLLILLYYKKYNKLLELYVFPRITFLLHVELCFVMSRTKIFIVPGNSRRIRDKEIFVPHNSINYNHLKNILDFALI